MKINVNGNIPDNRLRINYKVEGISRGSSSDFNSSGFRADL
ncbi:MAG: hypothetical protein WBA93_01185 [Microcoleaceae cyanobacterium]